MATDQQDTTTTPAKDGPYAMYVVLTGLIAIAVVSSIAMFKYDDATMVVTALGPVTGLIATIVGAYFGMRGASLAQQKAADAEVKRSQIQAAAAPAPGQ